MKYVYKIITVILAIVAVVVLFTAPIAEISVKSAIAQLAGYIGQYKNDASIQETIENNDGNLPEYITADFAFSDLFDEDSFVNTIFSLAEKSDTQPNEKVKVLFGPAVCLLISIACIIICAIAVISTVFTKNNRNVVYAAVWGIVSCFMYNYSFETIAEMFMNKKITFSTILNSAAGDIIGEFARFEIPGSFWAIAGVFAAIIIFTVLYNYTLPEKDKAQRKEMLGEV